MSKDYTRYLLPVSFMADLDDLPDLGTTIKPIGKSRGPTSAYPIPAPQSVGRPQPPRPKPQPSGAAALYPQPQVQSHAQSPKPQTQPQPVRPKQADVSAYPTPGSVTYPKVKTSVPAPTPAPTPAPAPIPISKPAPVTAASTSNGEPPSLEQTIMLLREQLDAALFRQSQDEDMILDLRTQVANANRRTQAVTDRMAQLGSSKSHGSAEELKRLQDLVSHLEKELQVKAKEVEETLQDLAAEREKARLTRGAASATGGGANDTETARKLQEATEMIQQLQGEVEELVKDRELLDGELQTSKKTIIQLQSHVQHLKQLVEMQPDVISDLDDTVFLQMGTAPVTTFSKGTNAFDNIDDVLSLGHLSEGEEGDTLAALLAREEQGQLEYQHQHQHSHSHSHSHHHQGQEEQQQQSDMDSDGDSIRHVPAVSKSKTTGKAGSESISASVVAAAAVPAPVAAPIPPKNKVSVTVDTIISMTDRDVNRLSVNEITRMLQVLGKEYIKPKTAAVELLVATAKEIKAAETARE